MKCSRVNVRTVCRNKNHGSLGQMAIGRFVGFYQKAFISFILKATFMSSHDCNIVNNIPVWRRCKFYLHCFLQPFFEACPESNNRIEAEKYVSRVLPENKVTCYEKLWRVYQFIEVLTLFKGWLNKLTLCSGHLCCNYALHPFTESADHKTLSVYKFVRDWEQ